MIPGLLQTAEYAREIIRTTAMSEGVETRVDALVEVRLARQAVLTRESDPLTLWAVIAEQALRSTTEDPGVMDEQLGAASPSWDSDPTRTSTSYTRRG